MKKSYKAVFFDAGGTLFSPHPSVGEIYARVAKKHGILAESQKIETIFRSEFSKRDKMNSAGAHATEKNEKDWWRRLVWDVFQNAVGAHNDPPLHLFFAPFFEELYDLFATAEAWKLYPETLGVLRFLKNKGLCLGIVSNWDSRLFSICKTMNINQYFDFILASAVVGFAKPDPKIFEKAIDLSHVKLEEAIHIGDSVENDIFGARNAGIDVVLVDRSGRMVEGIPSVNSLEGIISRIG